MHDVKLIGKYISIRRIPYFKVFIVAFTWSAITILPQLVDSRIYMAETNWKWLLFERFFFILSITLMFDVRDMLNDPKNLHTIPQNIGINRSKWLSVIFITIASLGLFHLNLNTYQLGAVLLIYLLAVILIYYSKPGKDDIYFTGWFDGIIGLHAFAIILFNQFMV
jgi:4-hydroxybenzoate polyprenyltransferase